MSERADVRFSLLLTPSAKRQAATLAGLRGVSMGGLLRSLVAKEWAETPGAGLCADGQPHEWGIDGRHANVFCKRCFTNCPEKGWG